MDTDDEKFVFVHPPFKAKGEAIISFGISLGGLSACGLRIFRLVSVLIRVFGTKSVYFMPRDWDSCVSAN